MDCVRTLLAPAISVSYLVAFRDLLVLAIKFIGRASLGPSLFESHSLAMSPSILKVFSIFIPLASADAFGEKLPNVPPPLTRTFPSVVRLNRQRINLPSATDVM